jgi:hypothetical protein
MKKSILDQFASDAISAPAAVTGGTGCGCPSTKKSKKSKKTKKTHKSKKTKSRSGCH